MPDFKKLYPTQGDLAREQLRRRGIPYFIDVQRQAEELLGRLAPESRKLFALCCAHRLMLVHERLPVNEQRPFTLTWRPVLDAMWSVFENGIAVSQSVDEALEAFYASPYNDTDEDGPDDAADYPAAASIFAAECFRNGQVKPAFLALSQAIDAALDCAYKELQLDSNVVHWDPSAELIPLARESAHSAVQGELKWQLETLNTLATQGNSSEVASLLKQRCREIGQWEKESQP